MSRKSLKKSKRYKLLIAFALGIVLFCLPNRLIWAGDISINSSIIMAQALRPEAVATQVYQRLPQLPRANQYRQTETGAVNTNNTLVSRLIRYHQYVKSRPLQYRLDWKLTLADYLGANEQIEPSRYPGSKTLQANPLESDRTAIKSLSRRQRNELVDTLVSIYAPPQPSPADSSPSTSSPQSPTKPNQPQLPQPGDAELLLP